MRRDPSIRIDSFERVVRSVVILTTYRCNLSNSFAGLIGPANHFILNNDCTSYNIANEGLTYSACNNVNHVNNNTLDKGSPAGISHSTTCVTQGVTGSVIRTNCTSGYRIRLTCTVNIVRPINISIRYFNARRRSVRFVRTCVRSDCSLAPRNVVRQLNLLSMSCGGIDTCNRFNGTNLP